MLAGTVFLLPLLLPALLLAGGGVSLSLTASALGMALYCSLFCSVCCLISRSAAGCGVAAFTISLAWLALAGGIVPPVLLPRPVQKLSGLSPVAWLMELAARPMGYKVSLSTWLCLAVSGAALAALALVLYRRRADSEEVGL